MSEETDSKNKSGQSSPLLQSDSALSVIHRIGLRYTEKIDYLKSASIPFEERIRIANKHTKSPRKREQLSGEAAQNNEP
jgi:hypothetical protein